MLAGLSTTSISGPVSNMFKKRTQVSPQNSIKNSGKTVELLNNAPIGIFGSNGAFFEASWRGIWGGREIFAPAIGGRYNETSQANRNTGGVDVTFGLGWVGFSRRDGSGGSGGVGGMWTEGGLSTGNGFLVGSDYYFGWAASTGGTGVSSNPAFDTQLGRKAARVIRLGLNASSPLDQTLQANDARAGTDINTAAGGLILGGGCSTGTAVTNAATYSGCVVLSTAPAGSSGNSANTLVARLIVDTTGKVAIGNITATALLDINSDILRLRTAKTPASAVDTGNQGDICWDSGYIYVCTATNTWKRTALTTF